MSDLFEIQESLSPRIQWMERIKEEHRIFTHYCEVGKWLAIPMDIACAELEKHGCELEPEEKASAPELCAGYCRYLDDLHLLDDGFETECDALVALATKYKWKLWNE